MQVSRRQALSLAAVATAGTFPWLARAADFPSGPVKIVHGYPGGLIDVASRVLADALATIWKQPVVVDAKPGGNEIIASDFVAKAPGDGQTIYIGTETTFANNPNLYAKMPFDPLRDLVPVASLEVAQQMLRSGQLDAFATNKGILFELREKLPDFKVSDDRWGLENLAIAIPATVVALLGISVAAFMYLGDGSRARAAASALGVGASIADLAKGQTLLAALIQRVGDWMDSTGAGRFVALTAATGSCEIVDAGTYSDGFVPYSAAVSSKFEDTGVEWSIYSGAGSDEERRRHLLQRKTVFCRRASCSRDDGIVSQTGHEHAAQRDDFADQMRLVDGHQRPVPDFIKHPHRRALMTARAQDTQIGIKRRPRCRTGRNRAGELCNRRDVARDVIQP